VLSTCRDALTSAGLEAGEIAAIGITNQRETTVVWDANTGEALHNAMTDGSFSPFPMKRILP